MKKYTYWLLPLLLLFLVTCVTSMYITTPDGVPVKYCSLPILFAVSSDTPDKYRQTLKNGILYWNDALNKKIFFDVGNIDFMLDGPHSSALLMVGVVQKLSPLKLSKPCGKAELKFINSTGCLSSMKIRISSTCTEDLNIIETIARHEAGHVLGLNDSVDFTSLMSSRIEPTMQHPVDATDEEIKAIKALYE